MSVNDYAEKKLLNNIWLSDMLDDKLPASRTERSDQSEIARDIILKDASMYPRITRRGYAGEEFFLKASKSVPRIGRRNNDVKESPKRSLNKVRIREIRNNNNRHRLSCIKRNVNWGDFYFSTSTIVLISSPLNNMCVNVKHNLQHIMLRRSDNVNLCNL